MVGLEGTYGPNDGGYIHRMIVKCAETLKSAQELYSQGHYPHSNAKIIPEDNPLRLAMRELAKLDEYYARFANTKPNSILFSTYEPDYQSTVRWNKYTSS